VSGNEPVERHALDCEIWVSPDPADVCSCGADAEVYAQRSPLLALPGESRAVKRVPLRLVCDDDVDEIGASA
jgi:hypothetical protein